MPSRALKTCSSKTNRPGFNKRTKNQHSQAPTRINHSKKPRPSTPAYSNHNTFLATALIGFHSTFATDDLQNMMEQANLSRTFIGMVIRPLLSNDLGPIKATWENHMGRCIAATVGKWVQTALLITPLVIFIAWGIGVKDVSLYFDGFEVATLFASCLYVDFSVLNGKSNYFERVTLIALFLIISIAAYFFSEG